MTQVEIDVPDKGSKSSFELLCPECQNIVSFVFQTQVTYGRKKMDRYDCPTPECGYFIDIKGAR